MSEPTYLLLIDDKPAEAEATERSLRQALPACQVRRAATRADCLAALADQPPDVIISECSLPNFDAPAVLHSAAALAPEAPVLILTAAANEAAALAGLAAG
ncbi:MAG: response regulator, partial [Anaerolineales bacterium]|nr:response regulator [Anaerolineales bacterium]